MAFNSTVGSGPSTPSLRVQAGTLAAATQHIRSQFTADEVRQVEIKADKVLQKLMISRSFFRERDLVRRILEQCQKDFEPDLVEKNGFEKLIRNVVENTPFVTIGDTGYLTTQEVADREKALLALAGVTTDVHKLNRRIVDAALRQQRGISDEQKLAVEAACLSDRRVTVIEGTAGTGKSFAMRAVRAAYQQSGYDVIGTAVGWVQAKVLESSAGLDKALALKGLLRDMQKARAAGTEFFRRPTLIIVDEAGMVGSAQMKDLLEETHRSKMPVKVVLTGDSLQLNPVEAGSALEMIVEYYGTTRIETIRRQQQASHRLAVHRFSQRRAGQGLYPYVHQEAIRWAADADARMDLVVQDYVSYRHAFPEKSAVVLALANKDVQELNRRIRAVYRKMGRLSGPDVEIEVTDGRARWEAPFAVGDEVVLRANSIDLQVYRRPEQGLVLDPAHMVPASTGVYNRSSGRIVAIRRSQKPVGSFDMHLDLKDPNGSITRAVLNTQTFKSQESVGFPVVHDFATTIYSSQGQTVNKTFLLDHRMIDFRLAYVAMSRHTDSVDIYLDETELHQRMDKMRGVAMPASVRASRSSEPLPEVLPVERGRYRRSEMLQTVALHWARDSQNLTVVMLEQESRLGKAQKRQSPPDKELAAIVRGSSTDPVIDFDPEVVHVQAGDTWLSLAEREKVDPDDFPLWQRQLRRWNQLPDSHETWESDGVLFQGDRHNQPYPKVDVARLLSLETDPAETTMVKPTEVENRNQAVGWEMPLQTEASEGRPGPMPEVASPVSEPTEEESFLAKTMAWLRGKDPETVARKKEAGRRIDASGTPVVDPVQTGPAFIDEQGALTFVDPVIPMVDEGPVLGMVDDAGELSFNTSEQGVSAEWLRGLKNEWWGVGRNNEPRVFARDSSGEIVARYALDGTCKVGEGFPPLWRNPNANETTPIMLVPGAREWFWASEHQARPRQNPESAPHVLWAAHDVDWRWIAPHMRNRQVLIARSKVDDAQIPWAVELQQDLWENWGISADIRPAAPGHVPPWEVSEPVGGTAPAAPTRPRSRGFT